jgi:sugar phosphate isomerase/epimerase
MDRRDFLHMGLMGPVAIAAGRRTAQAKNPSKRKFTLCLTPGSIGVQAGQEEVIDLAVEYGFESVEPMGGYLASLEGGARQQLAERLGTAGLVWGAAGLPVQFRNDKATFDTQMKALPGVASALREAGVTRVGTWIMPSHEELTYLQNLEVHRTRLAEVAEVLADNGLRLGLEYVGPKTSWTAKNHSFVHCMAEMKELIAAIDRSNVGFVLDSWHWYTAKESVEDLLTLTNSDVVSCDLNDAPAGISVDEQQDLSRELPCATGVIDLEAFMQALVKIGYDGPVRAEPFNSALNAMDTGAAVATTAEAMKKAAALVEA